MNVQAFGLFGIGIACWIIVRRSLIARKITSEWLPSMCP